MRAELVILSNGSLRVVIKPEDPLEASAIQAFFSRGFKDGGGGFDGRHYYLCVDIQDKEARP